jgi:threonine/homoserine/homoserine lactone efflux protein
VSFSLAAFAFGVTLAAAVGPITLLIVSTSATGGLWFGLRAGAGAALADLCFALLAFAGSSEIAAHLQTNQTPLRLLAAASLLLLGLWMTTRALRGAAAPLAAARPALSRPFLQTLALTIVNPLTVFSFVAFSLQYHASTSLPLAVWLAACVAVGSLAVQVAYALLGAVLGQFSPRRGWLAAANAASGLGISFFGLHGLYAAV